VPRILHADESKSPIALIFVIMDRLKGAPLADHERGLSEQECFAIYAEMGRLLRDIHAITNAPRASWTKSQAMLEHSSGSRVLPDRGRPARS